MCTVESVGLYSGDSVEFVCRDGYEPGKVKRGDLSGIRLPDPATPVGQQARARLLQLARTSELRVVDRGGIVLVPGLPGHVTPINATLVSEGLAMADRQRADDAFIGYCRREAEARRRGLGIWASRSGAGGAPSSDARYSVAECEHEIKIRSDPYYGLRCTPFTCTYGHPEGPKTGLYRSDQDVSFSYCGWRLEICDVRPAMR